MSEMTPISEMTQGLTHMVNEEGTDGPVLATGVGDKGPKYPWGLKINLEDQDLKKLGINEMPAVGEDLHLLAVVKTTGAREEEREGGDGEKLKSRTLTLQITHMAMVDPEEEEGPNAASRMYPPKE